MIKFFCFLLFSSFMVQAQMLPSMPVTNFKNVNILCKSKGATIAISEADRTYWQAEGDEPMGMQFKVTSWMNARCIHCFEAVGEYKMGNSVLKTAISSSYNAFSQKLDLTYFIFDQAGRKIPVIQPKEFTCSVK